MLQKTYILLDEAIMMFFFKFYLFYYLFLQFTVYWFNVISKIHISALDLLLPVIIIC